MIILSIKTDQPKAYLGLWRGQELIDEISWPAHRELSDTIHTQITALLAKSNLKLSNIEGLLVFRGPGSFTGLRISVTVFNSLAYGLGIPIVGSKGSDWQEKGIQHLLGGQDNNIVVPYYGAEANISFPKK